jgi:tetratricopeptide (TPR) repeat protein
VVALTPPPRSPAFLQELGPDHVEVAEDLSNLGALMRATGQSEAAAGFLRRALLLNRAALGKHHPRVAHNLDALGAVLQEQGRLREAEAHFAQVRISPLPGFPYLRLRIQGDQGRGGLGCRSTV